MTQPNAGNRKQIHLHVDLGLKTVNFQHIVNNGELIWQGTARGGYHGGEEGEKELMTVCGWRIIHQEWEKLG